MEIVENESTNTIDIEVLSKQDARTILNHLATLDRAKARLCIRQLQAVYQHHYDQEHASSLDRTISPTEEDERLPNTIIKKWWVTGNKEEKLLALLIHPNVGQLPKPEAHYKALEQMFQQESRNDITLINLRSSFALLNSVRVPYKNQLCEILERESPLIINFSGCSLNDIVLDRLDLSYADLNHAELFSSSLKNATCDYASLNQFCPDEATCLIGTSFIGASLRYISCKAKNQKANITHTSCWEQNNFQNADLTGNDFTNSRCLQEATLTGTIFNDCILDGCALRNQNLQGTQFVGCSLEKSNLSGAKLTDANFTEARFSYTNFSGCDFKRTNLTNVDLRNSILDNITIDETNVAVAELPHEQYTNPIIRQLHLVYSQCAKEVIALVKKIENASIQLDTKEQIAIASTLLKKIFEEQPLIITSTVHEQLKTFLKRGNQGYKKCPEYQKYKRFLLANTLLLSLSQERPSEEKTNSLEKQESKSSSQRSTMDQSRRK